MSDLIRSDAEARPDQIRRCTDLHQPEREVLRDRCRSILGFDASKPFNLTGSVTKVVWSNPHAWLYFDVTDAATQKVTNWAVELNSPNALMRAGWKRDTLKLGDVITVEGSLAKDGSPTGNARSIVLSTGQRLFAGSSQESTP